MPRFRTRKSTRRPRFRRRHRKKKVLVTKGLLGKKAIVRMKYATEVTITPSASSMAVHTFRANSIFDPDLTGVGHQPLSRDQYALLYNTYRVLSAKIKVTPLNNLATNSVPSVWGIYVDTDPDLDYVTYHQLLEDSTRTTSKVQIWGGVQSLSAGSLGPSMHKSFNAKRLLSKEGSNNATSFNSNPATGANFDAYFQVFAGAINGNTPNTGVYLCEITYTVELTDPIVLGQS